MEQMRLLAPLEVPVEQLANLKRLHLVVGTMPTANLARIQTALFRIPFVIIPAYTHADRTLVFAATSQEYAADPGPGTAQRILPAGRAACRDLRPASHGAGGMPAPVC